MKEMTHRDQIHGDVFYDPMAVALLDSEALQRLGRVYQLGYGHLIYRGGTGGPPLSWTGSG
jgi:HD superfamily phosphohydrolase